MSVTQRNTFPHALPFTNSPQRRFRNTTASLYYMSHSCRSYTHSPTLPTTLLQKSGNAFTYPPPTRTAHNLTKHSRHTLLHNSLVLSFGCKSSADRYLASAFICLLLICTRTLFALLFAASAALCIGALYCTTAVRALFDVQRPYLRTFF